MELCYAQWCYMSLYVLPFSKLILPQEIDIDIISQSFLTLDSKAMANTLWLFRIISPHFYNGDCKQCKKSTMSTYCILLFNSLAPGSCSCNFGNSFHWLIPGAFIVKSFSDEWLTSPLIINQHCGLWYDIYIHIYDLRPCYIFAGRYTVVMSDRFRHIWCIVGASFNGYFVQQSCTCTFMIESMKLTHWYLWDMVIILTM